MDIQYVRQPLGVTDEFNFGRYPSARILQHRSRILTLLGWTPFDEFNATLIAERILLLTQQQLKPEQVFADEIDFCWKQHIKNGTFGRKHYSECRPREYLMVTKWPKCCALPIGGAVMATCCDYSLNLHQK